MHKIIIGSPQSELNNEILLKREIFSPSNEIVNKPNTFSLDDDEESDRNYYDNQDSKDLRQQRTKRSMIPPKSNQYHCSIVVSPPCQPSKSYDPYFSQKQEGLDEHWQKSGLRIITLVARFIYQLKTNSEKLKIKLMNYRVFNIINDLSGDFKQFKQQQSYLSTQFFKTIHFQKRSLSKYSKFIKNNILNRVQVIQPESTFKIIWDIIVVFVIVLNIFYIPMSLSFEISKDNAISSMFFETIPSYIFILEILLNFNTAYYLNGIIHSKRTQIFWFYLKGNFFWDLLIAIPFILVQFSIPYIQFILLLRVTRVRSMVQNVEDLLNAKDSVQTLLDLVKLVYFIVFVTHMCACGWHLLGQVEIEVYHDNTSWLQYYGVYEKPWTDRYIMSLYWSVITTLTVGYGDVVPQTTIERFFVIIVAMVICGVFGYTISTIGEILKNLEEKESYFKQQMKGVNKYIKDKNLNFQLSLKVRKYFEYQIQIQLKQNQLDEEIMKGLNDQLKHEVLIDIYKKLLKKSPLITQNFNEKIIDNLCQKVKQANYAPGDDVVSVNSQGDRLIFVVDGSINCFSKGLEWSQDNNHSTNGRFFSHFSSGQVIGEQEFIMHSQFKHQFKAQTFVQVAILERSEFIEILKQQNDQYIKFNEQREKLLYQSKYRRICDVCNWTHHYLDCPFVFYQPHRWKIIKAARSSVPDTRNAKYTRISQRDLQARLNKDYVQECGIDFIVSNQFLQENEINQEYLQRFGLKFESVHQDSQQKRSTDRLLTSRGSLDKSLLSKRQSVFLQPLKQSLRQTATKLRSICQIDEESKAFSSSGTISHGIAKEESLILKSPTKESLQEVETRQQPLQKFNDSLDIDTAQEYSNYYPNFNLVNVIEELNKSRNIYGNSVNRSQLQERLRHLKLKSSKYQSNRDIRSFGRMTSSDRNITFKAEQ